MEVIKGYISSIIYRNKENLYTVFGVTEDGDEVTCTGYPAEISEGESVEVTGEIVKHPLYGDQLKVSGYRIVEPEGRQAVFRYLSSGAVKGVGPTLASRIIKKFGDDTMRILDNEPERLSEVRGISPRIARSIAAQMEERRDVRDAMIYLQSFGIGGSRALKIWERYGTDLYRILKENPYRLAEDISGIGFQTADEIAKKTGIVPDSDFRIRSGILYILSMSLQEGNSYLPESILLQRAEELLGVPGETVEIQLQNLAMDHKVKIHIKGEMDHGAVSGSEGEQTQTAEESLSGDGSAGVEGSPDPQVYSSYAWYLEQDIAGHLKDLEAASVNSFSEEEIEEKIRRISEHEQIELDELQKKAVQLAAGRGILLLSGGPGTGKTTTINTIIRFFVSDMKKCMLAAPTGRAAKRMTEATGFEAKTIHRMLGYKAIPEEENDTDRTRDAGWRFEKNRDDPLDADVIIIDEMSMVDLFLFHALLLAVRPGTRLILVGDTNQLPSVGPGRVFGDLCDSGAFCSITLQKIFRQAQQSDIIMNAHRILQGEPLVMDNKSRDFFFLERNDPQVIYKHIAVLIRNLLPKYVNGNSDDIQVLTPMRRGLLGAARLNEVLQSVLNPASPGKAEYIAHEVTFRVGDKVMQTKNNYQIEWEIQGNFGMPVEKGTGIFNGDFGVIREINRTLSEMVICFDEDHTVHYPFSALDDLDLAYAITVHKSQGSEYPAVILPLLSGPPTLFNRNLLYTAVTRARKCVVILGSRKTVNRMEANVRENTRYTGLKDRILEMI